MSVRVTSSALVAPWYADAPPRCRTSQYAGFFIPLSVSLGNDLADPVFGVVRLTGFKRRANALYWSKLLATFLSFIVSISYLSFYRLVCGARVFGLIGRKSLSPSLAFQPLLIT